MKRLKIFLFLTMAVFFAGKSLAQNPPSKKEIMDKMVLANAYFVNKWPDTGKSIVTNRERPSNIWTRAVHPDGFLGYTQGTGKQPSDSQPVSYTSKPDFEDYGLGCFLLAGSEIYRLN